jgi:hypothetical protein
MGLIETLLSYAFPPEPEPLGTVAAERSGALAARGRVVPRDLIASPLTGRRCVYYRYLVEEWRTGTLALGPAGLWHCAEQDEAIAEFYLDDGTGRAVIEPARARIALAGSVAPEAVATEHGRRAREVRIEPGDLVEVQGVADRVDDLLDGERAYRAQASRLVVRAPDGGELRIRVLGKG